MPRLERPRAAAAPQTREEPDEFAQTLQQIAQNPETAAIELLRARRGCHEATQAAEQLETMIRELVEKNASLFHLETLRQSPGGKSRAVCRLGSQLQELGVHPDIPVETLERLQPWEYVCVHEGVVIGAWHDDPALFAAQFGDVVTFDGYADRDNFMVRVARPGHDEAVVTLAAPLRIELLRPGAKLILQRDDPRWAIASLPAENLESRFEVPLDHVRTRLEDLAGLEELSEAFLQDILLRVVFDDVRAEFDLAPMRGALLYSYQPGMGKTAFTEGLAVWLRDFGRDHGFDVALYHVKPNQLKSMWWGEDARIVREELFGSIRARQAVPRDRPLVQLVVFDEIDSLQKRGGGERMVSSSSHSDALEALLVEMQGLASRGHDDDGPPAHLLCLGLTNRPDRLDEALKRPGRFGDLVRAMPPITRESAVDIMAIYAAKQTLPWTIAGDVRTALPLPEVREYFLGPAVARVFPMVVLQYATDTQRTFDVTAGEILAGVHYQDAVNRAKKRAALRRVLSLGAPAISTDDVIDCLLDTAVDMARQMEADPGMVVHQLQIKVPVARVTAVPKVELEQHRFLKVHSA
jgi:ATP-dependent 26S proteasome regulatory subunit